MRLIESWGSGIRRIIEDCAKFKLPEPEFSEIGDAFRVVVYRKQTMQSAIDQAGTEQVPSKYRASTEQVTEGRIRELIEYCATPKKRSEMQAFMGLSHREHFRETILQPLLVSYVLPFFLNKDLLPGLDYPQGDMRNAPIEIYKIQNTKICASDVKSRPELIEHVR